jgi:hypothetical protein
MTTKKPVVWVIAPLANDAIDAEDGTYATVGENFKPRVQVALQKAWTLRVPSEVAAVAIFYGAGCDRAHEHGQTLAACCKTYTRRLEPELPIYANHNAKRRFGTLDEMEWIILCAEAVFGSRYQIRYLFVSQPRHLTRVKWIVRLFFWRIDAIFVESGYTKQIPRIRGLLGYLKLIVARVGLRRLADTIRRWRTLPYDKG